VVDTAAWRDLSIEEHIYVLSCFATGVGVPEDKRTLRVPSGAPVCLTELSELAELYEPEQEEQIMQYDVAPYMVQWCQAEDAVACQQILSQLKEEKEISVGDFVKATLKIVNMVSEMVAICEQKGDISGLAQWQRIPPLLQKYIVINQSLYV
jgi:hypothetical protein